MLVVLGAFLNRKLAHVTVLVNGRMTKIESRLDTLESGGPATLQTPPDPTQGV